MLPLNKAKCCGTVEQGFFFKILSSAIKEKGERAIKSLWVTPERMYKGICVNSNLTIKVKCAFFELHMQRQL